MFFNIKIYLIQLIIYNFAHDFFKIEKINLIIIIKFIKK